MVGPCDGSTFTCHVCDGGELMITCCDAVTSLVGETVAAGASKLGCHAGAGTGSLAKGCGGDTCGALGASKVGCHTACGSLAIVDVVKGSVTSGCSGTVLAGMLAKASNEAAHASASVFFASTTG